MTASTCQAWKSCTCSAFRRSFYVQPGSQKVGFLSSPAPRGYQAHSQFAFRGEFDPLLGLPGLRPLRAPLYNPDKRSPRPILQADFAARIGQIRAEGP